MRYVRNKGSNSFAIEILPPEGVALTRDNQYEALLRRRAGEGDPCAGVLLEQYRTEKEHRRQLTAIRKERDINNQAQQQSTA